jgi:hypothetical protein
MGTRSRVPLANVKTPGHCRRRKIRCLVANDESTGRCANCIRLKKECNFYPVEHNPDIPPSQSTAGIDATPGQPLTPAMSSPRHPSSISGDNVGEFRTPFHSASSVSQNSGFGFHGDTEIDAHRDSVASGGKKHQVVSNTTTNTTSADPTNTISPSSSNKHSMATHNHVSSVF